MEESEKTEERCRLCDETGEKLLSIFDKNEESIEILQVIKECLPIIIYRTDPLSKQICETCLETLTSLSSFKKNCEEIALKQKEKLKDSTDKAHLAFLACGNEADEITDLKDTSTSTDDLNIFCNSCKQSILDGNMINGELELAIAESMAKNKVRTEPSEKSLRRRKVVPFYHELDDSLCSSLTEFTHNTEGSQCFEEDNSDLDSDDSSEIRPKKRRRIVESDEDEDAIAMNTRKRVLMLKPSDDEEMDETSITDLFVEEEEYRYQPFSLLQLTLNTINKMNIPDYEPGDFLQETIWPKCNYCGEQFRNMKILAIHEMDHIDVEMGEKIDNPIPWHSSRDDAEVRNKWLNYFDENGYEDDDIVIDDVVDTDSLLIPVDDKIGAEGSSSMKLTGEEKIVLVGTQPMVNDVYLGDYSKDERKLLYQSMRIQGVNKKFCPLCRYTFKDNWAIESHYFSLACYYTCRYCGMRFNKQRHKFKEHCDEHEAKKDEVSEKIFAASKLSNIIPKIIHPPKPRKIVVTQHNPPPEMVAANNQFFSGQTSSQATFHPYQQPNRRFMERKTLQPNLQIKEEPSENTEFTASQSKTGNQAYFCRKCYKVFFKLDEFNVHSKNCDFSQFPQMRTSGGNNSKQQQQPTISNKNGDISPSGRPVRNCAKEIGPYKDDVYLPDHILKEPKASSHQTSFVCFICNTPFPTIYSRNSHMRIHKGETQGQQPPYMNRPRFPPNQIQNNQHYRQPMQHYPPPPMEPHPMEHIETMIKQEPMDMATMEPMVEIHEQEQNNSFPETLGDGAVSITPIAKPKQRPPMMNPNVMKFVQNNPQLSIQQKKTPDKFQFGGATTSHMPMGVSLPDPDRSYKCSSCWEAFANKSHLYFHKKNQCEGSRLPCPFCKKRFGTEAEYSSHIYYSHPE